MKKENLIAQILFIIGVVVIALGFIIGLITGYTVVDFVDYGGFVDYEYHEDNGVSTFIGSVVLTWTASGFISGMLFIGLAEIVELLHKINLKLRVNSKEMDISDEPNDNDESDHFEIPDNDEQTISEVDTERIHKLYKNHTIEEIIPTPYEYFCIVKLSGKTSYDIVELGGFVPNILSDKEQLDVQKSVKAWYEKEYLHKS